LRFSWFRHFQVGDAMLVVAKAEDVDRFSGSKAWLIDPCRTPGESVTKGYPQEP
jgi:hypothetical protein